MMRWTYMIAAPVLAISGLGIIPNIAPPPAAADCTSAGGTTICAQGESRGANTGEGPSGSAGPWVPYPCEYDWYYCDDVYGWGINIDLDPGRPDFNPGGPGIGDGGGGNRPGGGGGGGRPGGGGGGRR